jgi:hypothetical protein
MLLGATVAVVLLAEAGAAALTPPPAPAFSAPLTYPTWSLGAGLFLSSDGLGGLGLGGIVVGGGALSAPAVTPSVSLERAFSPAFALGVGLQGGFNTTSSGMANSPSGSLGVGVSPRFVLTTTEAPVSFTVFSTVMIGYSGASGNINVTGTAGEVTSLTGSISGGGALELKLLERLALRVQATFARLYVSRAALKTAPSAAEAIVTGGGVSFIPSPGLELRVYL